MHQRLDYHIDQRSCSASGYRIMSPTDLVETVTEEPGFIEASMSKIQGLFKDFSKHLQEFSST